MEFIKNLLYKSGSYEEDKKEYDNIIKTDNNYELQLTPENIIKDIKHYKNCCNFTKFYSDKYPTSDVYFKHFIFCKLEEKTIELNSLHNKKIEIFNELKHFEKDNIKKRMLELELHRVIKEICKTEEIIKNLKNS